MRSRLNLAIITLAVVGMLAGALAAFGSVNARGNAISISGTVPVMDFRDHINAGGNVLIMNPQERGTSDLVRSRDGIAMNVDTTDLPVGGYSIWGVIFNNPSACSDGECGLDDAVPPGVNPEAEATLIWITGGFVGPDRMGHFSASLRLGVDAAPGPVLRGPGLTDPLGAEIHLVVRYHGPTDWSDPMVLGGQITTVNVSCDTFKCFDPQVTAHK